MGEELLFFDTFSHEVNEDLNLDLVQFPKPVYITEVRIIPLGARVQADFPGGLRLGATNPSKFHIEFFVNDLGKPGASTFECLGNLDYNQNDCINFRINEMECYQEDDNNIRQIPTDGLVLRGWYTTITLAVYGKLTKTIPEPIAVQPPENTQLVAPFAEQGGQIPADVVQIEERKDYETAIATDSYAPETYEAQPAYVQPLPSVPVPPSTATSPKDARPFKRGEATRSKPGIFAGVEIERDASSESDWDRDEREEEEAARRNRDDNVATTVGSANVIVRSPPSHEVSRSTPRGDVSSRGFSRSSSRERDYHSRGKRDWSRSPDYRHSRRTRTLSYERSKRDKSREHERRTPPESIAHEKRPRTPPPIVSPRRPRTPDRSPTANFIDTGPTINKKIDHDKRKYEKVQPIRAIDHHTEEKIIKSPALREAALGAQPLVDLIAIETVAADDDITSQEEGEPFEPILSDEEIGDEPETSYELDEDFAEFEDVIRPFNVAIAPFERSNREQIDEKEFELTHKILQKIKVRDNLTNVQEFINLAADAKENWVHSVEHLIQVLYLIQNFSFVKRTVTISMLMHNNTETIITLLKIGLDFDCAMQQSQPGYIIRHIKIGARLAELLGCCNELIGLLLFRDKYDIFNVLFELYSQKYMSLSIKLMIIKAIYSCLDSKVAMDYFLTVETDSKTTVYQQLIHALQANPLTRVKFALRSLMKKVNLYESLQLIREIVTKFFVMENFENRSTDLQLLKVTLDEVLKAYTWDKVSYTQPKRFLPVAAKYEHVPDAAAARCTAFSFHSYFSIHAFLETLLLLISNQTYLPQNIIELSLHLIEALSNNSAGLEYLYCNNETAGVMIKCLLQTGATDSVAEKLTDLVEEEQIRSTDSRCYQLGIEIAFKIKSRYYLDEIAHISNDKSDMLTDSLQSFYNLAYCNPLGRVHIANTIGMENNILVLLNVIERERKYEQALEPLQFPIAGVTNATSNTSTSSSTKLQSPVIGFAVDLIDLTVRHCAQLEYLHEHGAAIMNLCKSAVAFDPTISIILQDMAIYLKPLEISNVFAYDDINPLCDILKQSIEFVTTFPGDIITTLRLIKYLAIEPFELAQQEEHTDHAELKFKFVVLQLYSADGISILSSILEKLTTHFEQPGVHTGLLATHQGIQVCQIVEPVIQVLQKMLTFVINSRNTQFKDLTVIEQLLKTYTLMHHMPGQSAVDAEQIQKNIIQILLAYTQPTPTEGVDTESVHKSLWTQMLGEVIRYILSGPYTFLSGLLVLSELLPIALPIYTTQPLLDLEVTRLITERQLWSAHLHPKSSGIAEIIQTIATTCCPELLTVLTGVCLQLADLAPNMGLLVTKTLVDMILQEVNDSIIATSGNITRLLHLLGNLAMRPAIKICLISIMSGKLCEQLVSILTNTNNTKHHIKTQKCIFRLLNILLNADIGLMKTWPDLSTTETYSMYANAMPSKDVITAFVIAVIDNLLALEPCRLEALKTLSILVKYDFTIYILRSLLNKRNEQIYQLLGRIVSTLSDSSVNAMALPFLMQLLTFLQDLIEIPQTESPYRTIQLSANDLALIVNWTRSSTNEKIHPLRELKQIINDNILDNLPIFDNDLRDILDNLLKKLEESIETADLQEILEPSLPAATGIVKQFSTRAIFILIDDYNETYHANYWLNEDDNSCVLDALEDIVTCDLTDVIKTYLPTDVNITSECKRLLHLSASPQSNRERTTTAPCFRTRRVEVEPTTGRPEKKIYVTRGRGFTRTPPTRGDLFRSRPPNTSRPPSLHVDDFLALETCGAQPTGPTGYNKLSREIINIRSTRGGRGRGNFGGDRGRLSQMGSGTSQGVYRQTNRRTNSPSTWQSHAGSGGVTTGSTGGTHLDQSLGGGGQIQHFRTATSEPVVGPNFQNAPDYSTGSGTNTGSPHFGNNQQQRGRMRGLPRPLRSFTRQ